MPTAPPPLLPSALLLPLLPSAILLLLFLVLLTQRPLRLDLHLLGGFELRRQTGTTSGTFVGAVAGSELPQSEGRSW